MSALGGQTAPGAGAGAELSYSNYMYNYYFFCVLFSKWTNGKAIVQYDNSQGSSRKLVTDPLENNAFSAFQQWSESDTFQNLMVA